MHNLASFRPDDHPALVAASLACPVCLSGDVAWALRIADFDDEADCRCRRCRHRHVVSLRASQALRLWLDSE